MKHTINRRKLLRTALVLGSALATLPRQINAATQAFKWRNWGGNLHSKPSGILVPKNEEEVAELIRNSSGELRPVGSGHSWSGLVPTDGALISLDRMNGLIAHDPAALQADVWGGTKLFALGPILDGVGQAVQNMSDINYQALAGAVATSTHGTGMTLGSMSSYVLGMRLVTPGGELVDCDANNNSDLFRAAQTSLGVLGVNTRLKLQNQAAHRLHQREWLGETEQILENIDQHIKTNQQFELFPLPHTPNSIVVVTNPADQASEDIIHDEPTAVNDLREAFELTRSLPFGREFVYKTMLSLAYGDGSDRIGPSYQVLAHPRTVPFIEMEYTVPAEQGANCLREVLETIRNKAPDVGFPLEYRYVKADNAMLSMFSERDGCSISMHQFADQSNWQQYFELLEPVFHKFEGRPHWGKWHSQSDKQLAMLYPQWQEFKRIRRELDPSGRMLNPYLRQLFGV